MTAGELLTKIREAGGRVWLEGFAINYRLPKKHKRLLLQELRANRSALFQHLLEQEPKVPIPVPCTCDEKDYPHYTHSTPVIPPGAVWIKGDLRDLSAALGEAQRLYGNDWKMCALLRRLKENRRRRNDQEEES